jgi:glycosyltransferase involved in cell wall biosynthesis
VVHDGIDPRPFDTITPEAIVSLRKEIGLESNSMIGIFGRLSPWKGQHILLEAISVIPGMHAVLIGDALFGESAYAEGLKVRASQPDIAGRVHFLGFRRDIPALMQAMDIIVHASTSPEPFGLVIVEGMLARKPVIATRAGGAIEIIQEGESGVLVTPGSIFELRAALERLLADPHMTERLSRDGRRRAEVFSLDALFLGISAVIGEFQARDSKLTGKI